MCEDRFWLHDGDVLPRGADTYDGPAPLRLDELRRVLPRGWTASRGWYVGSDGEECVVPTTIVKANRIVVEYFPARPRSLTEGRQIVASESPEREPRFRSILRTSCWVRVLSGIDTSAAAAQRGDHKRATSLKLLEDNPRASPMTPDHPGWLDDGETVLTFSARPRKRQ